MQSGTSATTRPKTQLKPSGITMKRYNRTKPPSVPIQSVFPNPSADVYAPPPINSNRKKRLNELLDSEVDVPEDVFEPAPVAVPVDAPVGIPEGIPEAPVTPVVPEAEEGAEEVAL